MNPPSLQRCCNVCCWCTNFPTDSTTPPEFCWFPINFDTPHNKYVSCIHLFVTEQQIAKDQQGILSAVKRCSSCTGNTATLSLFVPVIPRNTQHPADIWHPEISRRCFRVELFFLRLYSIAPCSHTIKKRCSIAVKMQIVHTWPHNVFLDWNQTLPVYLHLNHLQDQSWPVLQFHVLFSQLPAKLSGPCGSGRHEDWPRWSLAGVWVWVCH